MRNRPPLGPQKIEHKAKIYLKMSLFGEDMPCLVDTGCELTLVPKDLLDQFSDISLSPSIRQVWAANNILLYALKDRSDSHSF